ncbi:MAG TPA: GNAT family N-acetyltransferase [Pseudolabrys sp.]
MLKIRPAIRSDAMLLLEWRNDPLTRKMFKTSDTITWSDHIAWLEKRIAQVEPHLYVAENENDIAIGTIRVDDRRLSYTVGPSFRGRGYATEMLIWARNRFGVLIAEIRHENVASIRAAKRAGHEIVLF